MSRYRIDEFVQWYIVNSETGEHSKYFDDFCNAKKALEILEEMEKKHAHIQQGSEETRNQEVDEPNRSQR